LSFDHHRDLGGHHHSGSGLLLLPHSGITARQCTSRQSRSLKAWMHAPGPAIRFSCVMIVPRGVFQKALCARPYPRYRSISVKAAAGIHTGRDLIATLELRGSVSYVTYSWRSVQHEDPGAAHTRRYKWPWAGRRYRASAIAIHFSAGRAQGTLFCIVKPPVTAGKILMP